MRERASSGASRARQTTAAQLLAKLVATGWYDFSELARELVVSEATVSDYVSGERPIPLDRQLCLAVFVIEKVPPLARWGHRLRGQVEASMRFQSRVTETHLSAPPDRHWPGC